MTEKRVWRELGLDGYRKERGMGGGGGDSCWSGYHLGTGYGIVLYFDAFDEPGSHPRLVGARLDSPQGAIHMPKLTLQRPPAAGTPVD